MMGRFWLVVVCALGLSICSVSAGAAEQAYVTDSFKVTMRTGPSTNHKIISFVESGEPLEILAEQEGWSQVRRKAREGEPLTGWVLTRYLMTREPWEMKAGAIEEKYERLKEMTSKTRGEWEALSQENQSLKTQLEQTAAALNDLEQRHGRLKREASDVVALKEAHERCSEDRAALERTVKELREENDSLRSNERNKWFVTGALVLFAGLIIGLALGRQQKKRKSLLID